MMRGLALLLSLPACALGVHALAAVFVPTLPGLTILGEALSRPFAMAGQLPLFTSLQGLVPGAAFLAVGVALLVVGLRRGARASAKGASGAKLEASGESAATDKGAKKIEKRAAALAKKGEVKEAAELCAAHGLSDQAVRYWVQAGDIGKAAGIRQDQNRFKEAAELYLQAGQHDAAAGLYAARGEFERAGDCYRKGGRMSVAAEMYEKAGRHLLAGECYVRCEFYRHAAQAFLKVQDFDKAAKALEKAIEEESQRVGNDRHGARELKKLVVQAGRLYDAAGDFASAARVLERGECWAAAGEIAARNKLFDRAAEYFQRAGNMPKAAEALRALGDDQAAAQVMGEYMRDKGDPEEAARLLVEAGDFGSAGDLYRNREDFKQAAECYERAGDIVQAAEMFRLAQDWERAAASYERLGHWPEAAECAAQAGDAAREAALLTRGGQLLQAGRTWIRAGNDDEAIKVLQQVRQDQSTFREASALLGEIFRKKGKHSLAVKKLQQAIGDAELDAGNIALWYDLATVYETAGMPRQAVEIYEKILTADYHYKDVEQRLEVTRSLARAVAGSEGSGTSQDSLTPNPRPGRYRIVGELGRGGMGIVYKAEDTVLDRIVALKVLPDALRDNPQALKNFLREAKSAAKLNHPNIVTVYDAGEQDGRYYIAMEHVDGTTLKEIVRKRGAIAAKGALNVALQMCEALHYAHAQKIIHRDVKTANTMWTRDKKAKIMDFGLAKVVEEVRNHTTLVSGTPYYMSPEQTLGRPVDHRTDLYSLGVTLFELVTGTLPFREGNVPYHHVHTPAPDPRTANPAVPAGFAEVIGRCLAKEPDQRPQTAREVAQALRAVAG